MRRRIYKHNFPCIVLRCHIKTVKVLPDHIDYGRWPYKLFTCFTMSRGRCCVKLVNPPLWNTLVDNYLSFRIHWLFFTLFLLVSCNSIKHTESNWTSMVVCKHWSNPHCTKHIPVQHTILNIKKYHILGNFRVVKIFAFFMPMMKMQN